MARTMSATRRGNFAVVGAALLDTAALAQSQFNTTFSIVGRGDAQRGLLIALAALMTIVGAAAPLIGHTALSAILFLTGAAVAILLSTTPSRAAPTDRTSIANGAAALFPELCAGRAQRTELDRAAWARLTAHMSHEFRTPLNAVLGFSELMSSEAFGPIGSSCYGDYARNIHDSGRKLLKSAEDALAITALLTAPERKGPAPVTNIADALEEALAFHKASIKARNLAIAIDAPAGCLALADPQTVRQLLINLLADVAQTAQDGARLAITAETADTTLNLSVSMACADIGSAPHADAFAVLLARTLCELSGASLSTGPTSTGRVAWTVAFAPAAQRDLFTLHS